MNAASPPSRLSWKTAQDERKATSSPAPNPRRKPVPTKPAAHTIGYLLVPTALFCAYYQPVCKGHTVGVASKQGGAKPPQRRELIMAKKIAVVAANGKAGRLIVKEAVERGFGVTAFTRSENQSAAQASVVKDLMDLTAEDLAGFDVVVDAFGAWTPETLPQHSTTLAHLCDALSGTDTRLLVVGGAGSLYVNPEHTATVADGPDFPEVFKPLASAMATALAELR